MSQVKEYPVEVHLLPGGQGRVIVDDNGISQIDAQQGDDRMSDGERWAAAVGLLLGIALSHIGWGLFILAVKFAQLY